MDTNTASLIAVVVSWLFAIFIYVLFNDKDPPCYP